MKRDPLDQLRLVTEPVAPGLEFADELEGRMRRALDVLLVPLSGVREGEAVMQTRVIEPAVTSGVAYEDVGRAVRWLTEILGLRVARHWGPQDQPIFAYLAWRTEILSVWVRPTDNPWSEVGPVSIGLLADEQTVESAYERAVAAGADVVRPLRVEANPAVPEGYLGFSLRDPEGNLWSMYTRGPRFEVVNEEGEAR